jgi:hypothetical protein
LIKGNVTLCADLGGSRVKLAVVSGESVYSQFVQATTVSSGSRGLCSKKKNGRVLFPKSRLPAHLAGTNATIDVIVAHSLRALSCVWKCLDWIFA